MRLARGAMPGGQKTMEGRIEIAPIENPRHRRITYSKRKAGLVRKATELAVLCDADVAVLMCNADQRLSVYSSISVDDVLERFSHFEGIPEARLSRPHLLARLQSALCSGVFSTPLAIAGLHGGRAGAAACRPHCA